jgi:hypothetical protein
VRGKRFNRGKIFGEDYLSEEEVTARLVQLGPGALALVHDALQPNTISGDDRTPFVRVVEEVGSKTDVPLLIDLLGLVVSSSSDRDATDPSQLENNRRDKLSEAALHRALEKITETENPKLDRKERVQFWHAWWADNGRLVMTGRD